jgi:ABC-2 type transport system permease protein
MLWYKAWLETRARFLVSLAGMVVLVSYFVYQQDHDVRDMGWYYRTLHSGHALLAAMWVAAVIFLMMGGLLREKALGTSAFTLALPVGRARLMAVRILCGLVQALALAVVPWAAMYVVGAIAGKPTSLFQAWFHVVLLGGGGSVFFASALLVSSLIQGGYTAAAVSFGILFADAIVLGDGRFSAYSPWNLMLGIDYFDGKSHLFVGLIPWLHIALSLLTGAFLIAIAIRAIQRREF